MQQCHRAPAASVLSARLTTVLHVLLCGVRLRLAHLKVVRSRCKRFAAFMPIPQRFPSAITIHYVLYKAQQLAGFSTLCNYMSRLLPYCRGDKPPPPLTGKGGSRGFGYMLHGSQHTPVWHNTSPEEGRQGKLRGEGGRKPMPRGGKLPNRGPGKYGVPDV